MYMVRDYFTCAY